MEISGIREAHAAEGRRRISELKKKIGTTEQNIEISEGIIVGTPSDTQRGKLIEKNTQRKHAISSMKKEIQGIEQTLEERAKELDT